MSDGEISPVLISILILLCGICLVLLEWRTVGVVLVGLGSVLALMCIYLEGYE